MFQHNVIDSKQKLIERQFNRILRIDGSKEKIELLGIKSFNEEEEVQTEDGTPLEKVDVEAEAKAKLRGSVGGVTSILDIASQVSAGTIQKEAGQSILEIIFGLSVEDSARVLVGSDEDLKPTDNANE